MTKIRRKFCNVSSRWSCSCIKTQIIKGQNMFFISKIRIKEKWSVFVGYINFAEIKISTNIHRRKLTINFVDLKSNLAHFQTRATFARWNGKTQIIVVIVWLNLICVYDEHIQHHSMIIKVMCRHVKQSWIPMILVIRNVIVFR